MICKYFISSLDSASFLEDFQFKLDPEVLLAEEEEGPEPERDMKMKVLLVLDGSDYWSIFPCCDVFICRWCLAVEPVWFCFLFHSSETLKNKRIHVGFSWISPHYFLQSFPIIIIFLFLQEMSQTPPKVSLIMKMQKFLFCNKNVTFSYCRHYNIT